MKGKDEMEVAGKKGRDHDNHYKPSLSQQLRTKPISSPGKSAACNKANTGSFWG